MKTIPLTKGRVALVDDDDYEHLNQMKWHLSEPEPYPKAVHTVYPRPCPTGTVGKRLIMHRLILNAPPDKVVDHIDGNTLNNQKSNLRLADRHQNGCNAITSKRNTSGFKGVSKGKSGRWIAQISCKRKWFWLGSYATKKEAAVAYDVAAMMLHGEFAKTNKMLGLL